MDSWWLQDGKLTVFDRFIPLLVGDAASSFSLSASLVVGLSVQKGKILVCIVCVLGAGC